MISMRCTRCSTFRTLAVRLAWRWWFSRPRRAPSRLSRFRIGGGLALHPMPKAQFGFGGEWDAASMPA